MKIILASKSPRRKEILESAGYDVVVDPSSLDESRVTKDDVRELVTELARGKAEMVAKRHRDAIVVAADTLVCLDGKKIGQQHDDASAMMVLKELLGKTHEVHTGICVIDTSSMERVLDYEKSYVTLKDVADKTLEEYIASGLYKGKAGAYNIDDPEFVSFVEHIEGSHDNIKGLPAEKVNMMISRL